MSPTERMLISLDSGLSGAILRVALGLAVLPAFRMLSGGRDGIWITLILFVALLLALRLVPAVLRRLLPFSREAKDAWRERRDVAKQHDSYQWQKLFWIGLGMLPHVVISGDLRPGELVLTVFCLIGGCAGLLFWRRGGVPGQGEASEPVGRLCGPVA
jgi:hypothetical protein